MKITLEKLNSGTYKFKVIIESDDKKKTLKFGARGYSDYTMHKNLERKKAYIARHKVKENFLKSGIYTKGFWAKNLLWNQPTIEASIKNIENKFGVKITYK